MLVVDIWFIPFGQKSMKEKLSTMTITNLGNHPNRPSQGNYSITCDNKAGMVKDFHRDRDPWSLVQEAIKSIHDGSPIIPKNCKDIVKKYLIDHGYDGLYHPDPELECGCCLSDLAPCNNLSEKCKPGYQHPGDDEFLFYIRREKYSNGN